MKHGSRNEMVWKKESVTPARLTHKLGAFIHSKDSAEYQISLGPNGIILMSKGTSSVLLSSLISGVL